MCCLRYEHDFYVASRRKYPKETKTIRTSRGEEKVIANDIFRERVTLRGVDGEVRTIPLADLRTEMHDAGDPLAAALESAARDVPAMRIAVEHVDHEEPESDTMIAEEAALAPPPMFVATAEPIVESSSEEDDASAPETPVVEGERRPQRRRGRRGGRRNRPSGGHVAGDAGGTPPETP
jgi:hypothetical protein